ncbi:DNA-binding transcriptional LysR family regulator [Microbacterium sp. W4I4]|uniref:LysR substrate-binding domain-containing protein n=1 Tax=Microbacterium sp. W4I4 TaxID=3042295 RepID=UPI00278B6DAD|nr:LysR substrate-binding domain-containing protein [Microbacterium sp. W4I4]MDQ0615747.1 DNA-binding transcriptional LysR family regulator [Microbacterium sp. W4I4]
MFTFDQLKSFVVVAEELHFGRAAERLNMTQPPLSRQIQKLEAELDFALFDRSKRAVRLTQAGRAFHGEAQKILSIAQASRSMAKRISEGVAGEIKIGITATGILELLGEFLSRLDEHSPHLTVDIHEMVSQGQIAAVMRGAIDIGFVRDVPPSAELESLLVRQEALIVAISSRHRLGVTSRPVKVAELEGERILTYSPDESRYFRVLVDTILATIPTVPSQEITQVHSMLALVAANKGIALVPQSAAKLRMSGIVFRSIAEHPDPKVKLRAVWRSDNSNPVFRTARAVLEEFSSSLE